jgi:hypothetical protein
MISCDQLQWDENVSYAASVQHFPIFGPYAWSMFRRVDLDRTTRGNYYMFAHLRKLAIATGAAATIATGAIIPRPASADTTSTLLTAAAVIGGIVIYNNVQHKQAQANSVVGYTRNGGTVYGDGRVVMPNGQTYYPNSNGQYANGGYYNSGGYSTGNYNNGGNYGGYNQPVNNGYNNGRYDNWQNNNGRNNNTARNDGGQYNRGQYNHGQYGNNNNNNDNGHNRGQDHG